MHGGPPDMLPTEKSTPGTCFLNPSGILIASSMEVHALTKNHFCSEQVQEEISFHTCIAPSYFFQGKNGSRGNFF